MNGAATPVEEARSGRAHATPRPPSKIALFVEAYARLRASEGRGSGGEAELLALPFLREGPLAAQWAVRAASFRSLARKVLAPRAAAARREGHAPMLLDLGAGNGWLCHRASRIGWGAVALDLRLDHVDGLGAAAGFAHGLPRMFGRVGGSFAALPLGPGRFDVVVFNAAIHYAEDLPAVLGEAVRVSRASGRIVILDSPFYRSEGAGEAMADAKRRETREKLAGLAPGLLALASIEYLTVERLAAAAEPLGLSFRRRRVLYPLWYEWRPVEAWWRGRRPPSRFDLWEAGVP